MNEKAKIGSEFERFVIDCFHFKTHPSLRLLEWQGDKIDINGVYPEANRNPDMVVSVKVGGYEYRFAVECKYRSSDSDGVVYWANREKIEIYNRFSDERLMPVFVVIGIGGTPSDPESVYIVPLHYLRYGKVNVAALELFKRKDPKAQFIYIGPKMILY